MNGGPLVSNLGCRQISSRRTSHQTRFRPSENKLLTAGGGRCCCCRFSAIPDRPDVVRPVRIARYRTLPGVFKHALQVGSSPLPLPVARNYRTFLITRHLRSFRNRILGDRKSIASECAREQRGCSSLVNAADCRGRCAGLSTFYQR